MKWANLICIILQGVILCACVKYPQIALTTFEREIFSVKIAQDSYTLYVAHDSPDSYHFALFDALGAPVADKILQNGKFSDAKLLPPSAKFDEIFIESLKLLERGESRTNTAHFEILRLKNE